MKITLRQAINILFIIIIVGGAAVWLYYFYPRFQSAPKRYSVGVLIEQDLLIANFDGFKAGMEVLGYKEGINIEYSVKNPKADEKLRHQYEDEIIAAKPDLIIAASTPAAKEFSDKHLSIPVLFIDTGSAAGIVENISSPEANVTGILSGSADLAGKRLEMLKSIAPNIHKIIISPQKDFSSYAAFMKSIREAAQNLQVEVVEIPSLNQEDFLSRLPQIISRKNGDAFMHFPAPNNSPNALADRKKIAARLISEKIVSINHNLERGANEEILASYGNSRYDVGEQAAPLADKILKGTEIKDIPVVLVRELTLEINLAAAKAIGIDIPQTILLRANKSYQSL
ncbi:MAG: ABC transporter substrate-binding protein [Candidatus Giovannonibacteria bacterium]|nr:ABC transporter substrate-binding protein [Candidatus Giovannonibacteria bacterium]